MNLATPHVTLIAHTQLATDGFNIAVADYMDLDRHATPAETLTEFAGRACYQSFDKPNPATAANSDYLARTLGEQGHWSIAEHATATLYFEGIGRDITHELIRHRHLSYSQLSQRFVDESFANFVLPPALRGEGELSWVVDECNRNVTSYNALAGALKYRGLTRKQAREAARCILPNATETRIVVTGNLRAWNEVIERRTQPDVDAGMREAMLLAAKELEKVSPVIFQKFNKGASDG